MSSDRFSINELIEPKEMKIYWVILQPYPFKTKVNALVLVLKLTKKSVKIVRLDPKKGLDKPGKVVYIKKENFKIIGLGNNACDYQIEDYLTCSSEVIRKHTLTYRKKHA